MLRTTCSLFSGRGGLVSPKFFQRTFSHSPICHYVKSTKPEKITDYNQSLLPDDQDWVPPDGYEYLYLPIEESVTLVPKGWTAVVGCWSHPWHSYFGAPAYTYGIGKEDISKRNYFDTGVTITGWSNVFPSEQFKTDAIAFGKTLVQNEIGDDLIAYIEENGAKTGGLLNGDEVKKIFNRKPINDKTPIIRGYQVSDDTAVISINMLKYDQDSTGSFDVPPMDIFFSVDYFLWRKAGKVIKVIYECPIDNMLEDRPTLDVIRSFSMWHYYGERAQFKNGSLEMKKN